MKLFLNCFVSVQSICQQVVLQIYELGVGLFEQRRPELVMRGRVDENEFSVERRQTVVNHHVDPLAVLPDLEMEHAGVVLNEQVVHRNHVVEEVRVSSGA